MNAGSVVLTASTDASTTQQGPWTIQGGKITDHPRFAYRGAMLDVARHFFGVDTVKTHIDEIARYQVNPLHLRDPTHIPGGM